MDLWYDLNGGMLRVETPDKTLLAPLAIYLDELRAEGPRAGSVFKLIVDRTDSFAAVEDGPMLFEGRLPDGPVGRLSALPGGRRLLIPERLDLRISFEERCGHLSVTPGNERLIGGSAGLMAIDAALASCGQHLVHGAALRLPSRDAAIVLWAPSGVGKTTASLALALDGFGLLTDDATVLGSANGSARVWGLPRPLKVHHNTARLLPAVGALLGQTWNAEGEQALGRETLRKVLPLPAPQAIPVAAMIIVGKRVEGHHLVRPLPKAEVLVKLADNNVGRAVHGVPSDEVARYQNLARAVAATPALQLNVGSELATLSGALLTAVG
jgi:hypothetical protein